MNRRAETGFTLIELLVAITLLAAIAVLMAGAINTGVSSAREVDARAGRNDALRLSQALIRRHLGAARPVQWRSDRRRLVAFEGAPDTVSFVAVMPAWPDAAGLYLVRLALRGGRLVMTRRITSGEAERFDFHSATDRVVLADGVAGLTFSYFGSDATDRPGKWHDRWVVRAALPGMVRLGGAAADRWPDLVVALMIDPQPR